jgi:hypothetical protein
MLSSGILIAATFVKEKEQEPEMIKGSGLQLKTNR